MKRAFAIILAAALLVVLAAAASAETRTMYAQKDEVKVHEKKSTKSEVVDTLTLGQAVVVEEESEDGKWYGVMIEYGEMEIRGWALAKYLKSTPPETVCVHDWSEWTVYREATCTREGLRTRSCRLCGKVDVEEIEKLPHEYSQWYVVREATCAEEGEQVRWCKDCGAEDSELIEMVPHEFGEWVVTRQASCALEGVRTHWCVNCDFKEEEPIRKLPHQYGAWRVTVQATDHSAGTRAKTCQVCGQSVEESFDPDGTLLKGARGDAVREIQQLLVDQGYLKAGGVDGMYGGGTERALIAFQRDEGLNADGVAWPQTVERLRHEFGKWKTTSKLTRNTDGVRVRTCKKCGFQERETVSAGAPIARGKRGEDVRNVQTMINELGYNAGKADGAYGPKLDAAFEAFAWDSGLEFTAGNLLPGDVDALVNAWIALASAQPNWQGQGGSGAPVSLVLRVNRASASGNMLTFNWSLTNTGSERCRLNALLLGFGAEHDFTQDNLAMAADGTVLKANGEGRATGSFSVSLDWAGDERTLAFCAVATSEKTGARWMSNVKIYDAE